MRQEYLSPQATRAGPSLGADIHLETVLFRLHMDLLERHVRGLSRPADLTQLRQAERVLPCCRA